MSKALRPFEEAGGSGFRRWARTKSAASVADIAAILDPTPEDRWYTADELPGDWTHDQRAGLAEIDAVAGQVFAADPMRGRGYEPHAAYALALDHGDPRRAVRAMVFRAFALADEFAGRVADRWEAYASLDQSIADLDQAIAAISNPRHTQALIDLGRMGRDLEAAFGDMENACVLLASRRDEMIRARDGGRLYCDPLPSGGSPPDSSRIFLALRLSELITYHRGVEPTWRVSFGGLENRVLSNPHHGLIRGALCVTGLYLNGQGFDDFLRRVGGEVRDSSNNDDQGEGEYYEYYEEQTLDGITVRRIAVPRDTSISRMSDHPDYRKYNFEDLARERLRHEEYSFHQLKLVDLVSDGMFVDVAGNFHPPGKVLPTIRSEALNYARGGNRRPYA